MEKYAVLILALLHFGMANNEKPGLLEIATHLKNLTRHLKYSSFDNCSVIMAENLRSLLGNMTINSAACKPGHPNPVSHKQLNNLIRDILSDSQSQGVADCKMKFGQCRESVENVALLHGYAKIFTVWQEASNKKIKG